MIIVTNWYTGVQTVVKHNGMVGTLAGGICMNVQDFALHEQGKLRKENEALKARIKELEATAPAMDDAGDEAKEGER